MSGMAGPFRCVHFGLGPMPAVVSSLAQGRGCTCRAGEGASTRSLPWPRHHGVHPRQTKLRRMISLPSLLGYDGKDGACCRRGRHCYSPTMPP